MGSRGSGAVRGSCAGGPRGGRWTLVDRGGTRRGGPARRPELRQRRRCETDHVDLLLNSVPTEGLGATGSPWGRQGLGNAPGHPRVAAPASGPRVGGHSTANSCRLPSKAAVTSCGGTQAAGGLSPRPLSAPGALADGLLPLVCYLLAPMTKRTTTAGLSVQQRRVTLTRPPRTPLRSPPSGHEAKGPLTTLWLLPSFPRAPCGGPGHLGTALIARACPAGWGQDPCGHRGLPLPRDPEAILAPGSVVTAALCARWAEGLPACLSHVSVSLGHADAGQSSVCDWTGWRG